MSQSMRKITYYENILEFKETTKEQLSLKEINNWRLCRTCLIETREDDVDLEKLSVMDVMQGSFLSIMEMLVKTTNLEMSTKEKLPLKVCKECFNKITTLYYFVIQVRKADKILKRLANKITFCNIPAEKTTIEIKNITQENFKSNDKILEENKTHEEETEEPQVSQEIDTFKENDIPDDSMIIEVEELFDIPGDFEKLEEFENVTEDKNQICKNDINNDLSETVENEEFSIYAGDLSQFETEYLADPDADTDVELSSEIESILEKELMDCPEISESVEEHTSQTDTKIKNKLNTVRIVERKPNVQEATSTTGHYKHRQPRVKSPLLNDFTCALCREPFERQHDLVKHVRKIHPNSKAYKCRVCHNFFSHIQSLSRHMNTHKDSVVVNECNYCSKTFVRADDLKRHLRTHTGERPYACDLCDKSYQQIAELKEHQKKHFGNTIYKCSDCDQTYTSRAGIFIHKKKIHKSDGDKDGPYICSLCQKTFDCKVDLRNHEKKHLTTQKFQCVECDAIFNLRKTFTLHQRTCNKKTKLESVNERSKRIKSDDKIPVDESEEDE